MLVLSAAVLASAWRDRQFAIEALARIRPASSDTPNSRRPLLASEAMPATVASLPKMSDLPTLLTHLEAIAINNRLGWSAADYRLRSATDLEPASLEVRTQFTGTYPQIRRMVTQSIDQVPAITFRQLSFTRTTTDAANVEAKLVFAILLSDGPGKAATGAAEAKRSDAAPTRSP